MGTHGLGFRVSGLDYVGFRGLLPQQQRINWDMT